MKAEKESIWQKNARRELKAAFRKVTAATLKLVQKKSKSKPARPARRAGVEARKTMMAAVTRRPAIIRKSGRRIRGRAALRRALGYGMRPDKNFEILVSNLFSRTVSGLLSEFLIDARRRPGLKESVVHEILSWHPGRKPTKRELEKVAMMHLEKNGFKNCSFIVIQHNDTEHPHLHIFVSRVRPDGSVVSLSQNWKKWTANLRQIEIELCLPEPPVSAVPAAGDKAVNAQRRAERRETASPIVDPAKVRAALSRSSSPEQLKNELEAAGIEITTSTSDNGRVRGVLLRSAGAKEWLAGSSISRDLSLSKIEKTLAENRYRVNSTVTALFQQRPEFQSSPPRPQG